MAPVRALLADLRHPNNKHIISKIIAVVAIGGGVGINDGNANYGKGEYDETTGVDKTTLEWLSVEYNTKTNECAVIATRNDSGKKRKFYLEVPAAIASGVASGVDFL